MPSKNISFTEWFSFEILIVLILIIGRFKKIQWVSALPVDATLLLIILACVVFSFFLASLYSKINQPQLIFSFLFLMFIAWQLLSWYWSPEQSDAFKKAILLVGICLPLYVFGLFIATDNARILRLLWLFWVVLFIYSLMCCIWYFLHPNKESILLFKSNATGIAELTGLGVILSTNNLFFSNKRTLTKVSLLLLAIMICAYATAATGERGPCVAAIFVILFQLIYFYKQLTKRSRHRFWCSILIIVAVLTLYYIFIAGNHQLPIINRIIHDDLQQPFNTTSIGIRLHLYQIGWHEFLSHPWIGVGIAGFSKSNDAISVFHYPHNIIVELAAETGIIGLGLFFVLILGISYGIWCHVMTHGSVIAWMILSIFIYAFLNALFCSTITSDRLLMLAFGLMTIVGNGMSERIPIKNSVTL